MKKYQIYKRQEVSKEEYLRHLIELIAVFEKDLQKETLRHDKKIRKIKSDIDRINDKIKNAQTDI